MDKARERAIRRQTMFWLLAFVVFLFFLWLLGDILLPFIAGMALAYFLDPVADLLER
ncbi:MAG: AI-2E family transporter, partial [Rhizobiaceae bacterium]